MVKTDEMPPCTHRLGWPLCVSEAGRMSIHAPISEWAEWACSGIIQSAGLLRKRPAFGATLMSVQQSPLAQQNPACNTYLYYSDVARTEVMAMCRLATFRSSREMGTRTSRHPLAINHRFERRMSAIRTTTYGMYNAAKFTADIRLDESHEAINGGRPCSSKWGGQRRHNGQRPRK